MLIPLFVTMKGTTIWFLIITLKTAPSGVMSKVIKDLSMSSSSPIGFEVEWHSSRFDKWYQNQGHGFKSWVCHCKGGIIGGTTISLPTTTLKIGPYGVMSKVIKNLSVFFSSPIGFDVEWHSSQSDIYNLQNVIFWICAKGCVCIFEYTCAWFWPCKHIVECVYAPQTQLREKSYFYLI